MKTIFVKISEINDSIYLSLKCEIIHNEIPYTHNNSLTFITKIIANIIIYIFKINYIIYIFIYTMYVIYVHVFMILMIYLFFFQWYSTS